MSQCFLLATRRHGGGSALVTSARFESVKDSDDARVDYFCVVSQVT
eukprot:COSAG06_NODE_24530_length_659_cov_9.312500_1_plen_45_part_10